MEYFQWQIHVDVLPGNSCDRRTCNLTPGDLIIKSLCLFWHLTGTNLQLHQANNSIFTQTKSQGQMQAANEGEGIFVRGFPSLWSLASLVNSLSTTPQYTAQQRSSLIPRTQAQKDSMCRRSPLSSTPTSAGVSQGLGMQLPGEDTGTFCPRESWRSTARLRRSF
jgi:hypothetical protein